MKQFFVKVKDKIKSFFVNLPENFKKNVPTFAKVFFAIALFSLIMHILCIIFPGFADFFNIHIAGGVRFVLSKITSIIPISLAELIVYMLIPLIVFVIVYAEHYAKKDRLDKVYRFFAGTFAVLSLFYTLFVFTLGTGYHGTPLADKLDLERKELSSDELIEVASWLADQVNECSAEVSYIYESTSVMPYNFKEMNEKLCVAYADATKDYDFIMGYSSVIKPIMNSQFLSKAGLLGMYSYYTGESNVNVDYMDYNLVFTCAHEMSHQRGISKEDEANFMAFLVCLESEDPYIRYSGYLNMFEYMLNPLYNALKAENRTGYYSSVLRKLDERARRDIGMSQEKTTKNQGVISRVSNAINNTFIKSQGDERGTASYGTVVELAAAYYYKNVKTD